MRFRTLVSILLAASLFTSCAPAEFSVVVTVDGQQVQDGGTVATKPGTEHEVSVKVQGLTPDPQGKTKTKLVTRIKTLEKESEETSAEFSWKHPPLGEHDFAEIVEVKDLVGDKSYDMDFAYKVAK